MPDDATSSPTTSTGFPDVGSELSTELGQARKRAATIGLLDAGLAIMAGRRQRGESILQPIARGAMVGVDQYSDAMKSAAQQMFDQQKAIIESRREAIQEQHQRTIEEHQVELERHGQATEEERAREDKEKADRDAALQADTNRKLDISQQTADTAARKAATSEAAQQERNRRDDYNFEPANKDPFEQERNSTNPKIRDYVAQYPPEVTRDWPQRRIDAERDKYVSLFAKEEGFGKTATGTKGKNTYEVNLVWPPNSKGPARPYDVVVDADGNPQTIKRKAGVDYPNVGAGVFGGGYKDVPPLSIFGGKKFRPSSGGPTWDTHRVDLTAHPVGSTVDLGNGKTGIVTADGRIAKPKSGAEGRSGEGTATGSPSSPGRVPQLYRDANGVPFKDPKGNYLYQGADGYFVGPDMSGKNLKPYAAPAA